MTLAAVKNYLDITWDDPNTDSKLQGIMARAESVLNEYAGETLDFDTDPNTALCQLYLDCCRYIWNHSYELFEINFKPKLLMLRAQRQVSDNAEDNADNEGADV